MIWYILYPFRGTTEPPQLALTHPIRKLLHHHGTATARHWLLSILLSVAIAVLFCYPVLFLDKSPADTGLYNLPHHVWTSATEFEGNPNTRADVEMRQIWVHGDYMKALDRRVLREALRVQNALIADGFNEDMTSQISNTRTQGSKGSDASVPFPNGCTPPSFQTLSWGFHSPLMYWNCSSDAIESDPDILSTINRHSMRRSFLNFTLRPTSVFAGKSFAGNELLAADALVITLFDQTGSGVGKTWELRSMELARNTSELWSLYPEDGRAVRSQLYEFRFKPMSLNDDFLLAVAYFIMAVYVLVSLRKLRAVKSQFGLAITVFAQMSISILASFTICGMLKINLARIPHEAYPFVILVIGLENMFRLINAVLSNPPEMPTVHRIGNALGKVGHLSLAAAGQNLFILWVLSRIVSPGVAAFCAFAAVALVFDFVFHLTFFVAVLSVDVQRMELQDSLDRINLTWPPTKNLRQERQSWIEAMRQGKLPFTTRIAGSTVIISFVLALNWHFFDNDNPAFSFRRIMNHIRATKSNLSSTVRLQHPLPPINQARTAAEWLRMQDHDTAKELIMFIKPSAYSFIARVYDPLLIVLKGAGGRYGRNEPESFLIVIRQLAEQHFFPVALVVVFTIAFVTLLMNYLLWNELPKEPEDGDNEQRRLAVSSLPKSHNLDVVWLKTCGKGHLISISLDRLTSIWLYDRNRGYTNTLLRTGSMTPSLWPIVASSIDDSGNWLALCTRNGRVAFWSLTERRFILYPIIELRGQLPVFFSFASIHLREHTRLSLIVITRDGCLTEVIFPSGQLTTHQIPQNEILSATLLTRTKSQTCVISASKSGDMHMSTITPMGDWASGMLAGFGSYMLPDEKFARVTSVLGVPGLSVILAVRSCAVDMIDMQSQTLIHTFKTKRVKVKPKGSLRILHSQYRACHHCGAPAVHSLSIMYTERETGSFVMQTYQLTETPSSQICLRPSSENKSLVCQSLKSATESWHLLENPGTWEATQVQSVIGIRKRHSTPLPSSSSSGVETNYFCTSPGPSGNALKQRKRDGHPTKSLVSLGTARTGDGMELIVEPDDWEAWTMSTSGEVHTTPLLRNDLFVTSPGPMAQLGKRSVAVGFGYDVKIITLSGHERFEEGMDEYEDPAVAPKWRMRRGIGRK